MVHRTLIIALLIAFSTAASGQAYHKKHRFSWKEKNGRIIGESVCYDKQDSLSQHLDCRRYARQWFREQCKDMTRQVRRQKIKETKSQRAKREKYCNVGIP